MTNITISLKTAVKMKLNHWIKGSLRDQHAAPAYGCRMASARKLTDLESQAIAAKIEELAPWFHNYEIAAGVVLHAQPNSSAAMVNIRRFFCIYATPTLWKLRAAAS